MYILICYLKHKNIQIIMTYRYLLCGFILYLSMITYPGKIQNDCVSVPSGGISGFWYSISKIRYFETKEYYCASSGCLAVVSSELKLNVDGSPKEQSTGLDYNYITEYSYGIFESLSLIVPRIQGGGSSEDLGTDHGIYDFLIRNGC